MLAFSCNKKIKNFLALGGNHLLKQDIHLTAQTITCLFSGMFLRLYLLVYKSQALFVIYSMGLQVITQFFPYLLKIFYQIDIGTTRSNILIPAALHLLEQMLIWYFYCIIPLYDALCLDGE
jgi:hypothetical protein